MSGFQGTDGFGFGSVGPTQPGGVSTSVVEQIDLTDEGDVTKWFKVPPGRNKMSVDIVITSGASWSTAKVQPQWTLMAHDTAHENAVTFKPTVTFDTDTSAHPSISVTGKPDVRLRTTTAASGADEAAKVIVRFA